MVKIGFICEGFTEFYLLNSPAFKSFLLSKNIELVNVINAKGAGNLLPHNISAHLSLLERNGSEQIFILTDLDEDACITLTKKRINARPQDVVIIAVKQIEAWLLADTAVMRKLLNENSFEYEFPEFPVVPFEKIRQLKFEKTGSGVSSGTGGKLKLLSIFLSLGFSIEHSAAHPNCPSANYFIKQLARAANTHGIKNA